MVFIIFFSLCPFMLHCIFVAKTRRWIWVYVRGCKKV
jgi:hypothetical protein